MSLSKPVGCEQLRVWPRPLSLLSDKLAVDVGLRRAEQCGPDGRHDLGTRATRYLSTLSGGPAAQVPAHEHAHAYTYVSCFSLIHDTATTSTSAWRTRNTVPQPFESRLADYRRIKDAGNKEAHAAARAVRWRLLWLLENHESSPDRYLLVPRVRQNKAEVRSRVYLLGHVLLWSPLCPSAATTCPRWAPVRGQKTIGASRARFLD